MMFWYYVLASRIDDGQAWSAATRWTSDSLTTSASTPGPCVDATFGSSRRRWCRCGARRLPVLGRCGSG